ncbi:hypothetical protein [Caldilinea sp.]|jgi:hypothetical protein|uniref:hypothetical protein n=1 Tax=Caldilinea sp. TaxID=2293560 RepID=UPI0021DE34DD|nr:hypothetical protein [Caldilinea sp.]GIV70416.1 MAG: hypothetical protein KatS3mg048_3278 [Caldilinea sp.]
MRSGARESWLVVLFVVGCLLFSYPLMELFNDAALLFGAPVSVLYLFSAWLGVIGAVWLIHERRR